MHISIKISIFAYKTITNKRYMEAILLLFFGYLLSRAINGKKSRKGSRSKNRTYSSGSTYSEYDTWRKSHGDQNKLF